MDHKIEFDDVRERRLELYYGRQVLAFQRADASRASVSDALSVAQDIRLPRLDLELRVKPDEYVPGQWPLVEGLGSALEKYLAKLRHMDLVRYSNSVVSGLTSDHKEAFAAVVKAAKVLEDIGFPVNWTQNVQKVLEQTEFGLRNGELVDRFNDLPERVALGEEMLLLGTLTFHRQVRVVDRKASRFKAVVWSSANACKYSDVQLRLREQSAEIPQRFRYCSDWIDAGSDKFYRFAV
jgi:hypothetical protein